MVLVERDPTIDDQWVLEIPTGATLSAPIRFDDDGDPVFSLPKAELLPHVALLEMRSDREVIFQAAARWQFRDWSWQCRG
jgi:hypothetical protein